MASAGKRVLMLLENNPYLRDIRVRQEAQALTQAGYRVSVICPAGPDRIWQGTIDGVTIYSYPAPPAASGLIGYLWEYGYSLLASFLLSLRVWINPGFDIIHSANPPDTAVFIALFFKLFGKRYVFDHHDLAPEMYAVKFGKDSKKLVHKALLWLERFTCTTADLIIATNQSYKSLEVERHRIPDSRVAIVRNGPDLARLQPTDPDADLRRKGEIILGYVGIISHQDGLDYLLRALKHLKEDLGRNDFYCVVIGKSDARASLIELTAQLGLEKHVWFTGFVPDADMIRYLSTADICVDPDPSNPFNDRCTMIKMMEYMALGKPIVAFDLPEHRVTAQAAAVYARPNNELDFARQIAKLADDPQRRKEMGQFGRERVELELAWSHQQQPLIEAYRTINSLVTE